MSTDKKPSIEDDVQLFNNRVLPEGDKQESFIIPKSLRWTKFNTSVKTDRARAKRKVKSRISKQSRKSNRS